MQHDGEDEIRRIIRQALARLHLDQGLDLGAVLSFASAEVLGAMVEAFGNEITAECLRNAHGQVMAMPTRQTSDLARVAPQGRA